MSESNTSDHQNGFHLPFSYTNLHAAPRNAMVLVFYLIIYSILDWFTPSLQPYPGVVAWYPPDGVSFAFLLTFGTRFAPIVALASLISSFFVYRLSLPPEALLGWAILISITYGIAAAILRRRVQINVQLQGLRDVLWLILSSGLVSALLAVVSVSTNIASGAVPITGQFVAAFLWCIGEMIGILVVTPVLLIHIMPWVKQFADGNLNLSRNKISLPRPPKNMIGRVISLLITFYLAFAAPALRPFHPQYLIAIPLLWIALDYGIKGASLGITILNFGTTFIVWLSHYDLRELSELQLLMLVISVVGLVIGAVRTEQIQSGEELQKNEKCFRALIGNSADGITLLDANGISIYDSPAAPGLLGYATDELIGHNVFELIHSDDLPNTMDLFQNLVKASNARVSTIIRFRHKDGSWRWIEAVATNLLDEPTVGAIVVNYRDITKRKQAEETLQASEDRYRDLVDNSHDLICTHDLDGRILSVNPYAEQSLGYATGALPGMNLRDVLTPGTQKYFDRYLSDIQRDGIATGTMAVQTAKGETLIWEYRNTLRTEGVTTPVVRGMARDITEQRRAEEAMRTAESKYRSIFEDSILGVFQTSPEGQYLTANPALANMFGYDSPAELIASISDLNRQFYVDPGRREEFKRRLDEYDAITGFESEVYRQDGSTIWVSENGRAVRDKDGTLLYYEGTTENITGRKQAEQALLKSEERFRALVENSLEEISLVDTDGTLIFESPTSRRPLGYTPGSFVDLNLFDLFHPDDRAPAAKLLGEVVGQSGSSQEALFRLRHQDGSWRWMEAIVTNLLEEPAVQAVVVNYRDVTERKRAEEEIRSRTAELLTLYELSRSLADAGNLDKILELVNRYAVESIHTTFARIVLLEGDTFVSRAVYPIRVLDHDLLVGNRVPVTALPYCQHVMEQNTPVVLRASNQEISSDERAALLLEFAQSLCLVPLWIGGPAPNSRNVLGLLMLGEARSEGREPFTPDKVRLAQSIGDQAAVSIRRMLLNEQTEHRLEHLTALREIDQVIASSIGLHLSLGTLLNQVTRQLGVDASAVWLFNSVSKTLEYSTGRGFRSKAFEQAKPLRLGEGYAGRTALERRIIHIPNLAAQQDNPRLMRALGGEAFVSYYGVPLIAKGSINGVLEVFHRAPLEPDADWLDFLNTLAGQGAIAIDNSTLFESLIRSKDELSIAYDETIEGWSRALDLRDKETEGHTRRVTDMTVKLARVFGLSDEELVQVRRGALLHDIGKMGVPDGILLKPGSLSDDEWVSMRKHPQFAFDMLSPIRYPRSAIDIPYCHHEKWDGTGYPRGLKGERIPLVARIFAVVDVWDALTSDRPYRPAWPEEKVLRHIQSLAGAHFDPQVVEVCLKSGILVRRQ